MPLQQTRVDVFEDIFLVFLGLGTLVGVVVISYVLYNAYKYRDDGDAKDDESLPTLGELPTGGKGGKKLFLSFGISAVIVISLVIWTYGMLLYVEDPQDEFDEEPVEIEVTGENFAWHFQYANGVEASSTMHIPADKPIAIQTTSGDVWHTFGIPDLRVKSDAIPGEYDETWFMAEETGEHEIKCFELCGEAHTAMTGNVQVMEEEAFNEWLNGQLTLNVEIVDQNEEPVTEVDEMTLEHTQNDQYEEDLVHTYTGDDFDENGTISLNHEDLQQGGEYNVTITFEDGQYETVEETIEIDGPSSETFTVGSADEGDNGNGNNESDGGGDGE